MSSAYWSAYEARWARRDAPKTTISVKLTAAELSKLDALRKKTSTYGGASTLEPRGDVLRRLLEQARKNHRGSSPSTTRKTKASSR